MTIEERYGSQIIVTGRLEVCAVRCEGVWYPCMIWVGTGNEGIISNAPCDDPRTALDRAVEIGCQAVSDMLDILNKGNSPTTPNARLI